MTTQRSEISFVVDFVHDGFFYPPADGFTPAMTDGHGFHHISIADLAQRLQFFRFEAGGSEHLVLIGQPLDLSRELIAPFVRALGKAFPGAIATFILEARTGWARAICGNPVIEAMAPVVAATVAATLAGGSWDDSDPIVVSLDTKTFEVSLLLEDGRWHVKCQSRPAQ